MSTKWTFVRVVYDSFSREVRKGSILPEKWAMLARVSLAPRNWRRVLHDLFLE